MYVTAITSIIAVLAISQEIYFKGNSKKRLFVDFKHTAYATLTKPVTVTLLVTISDLPVSNLWSTCA